MPFYVNKQNQNNMKTQTKNILAVQGNGLTDEPEELEVNVCPADRGIILQKTKDKMLMGVAHFAFIKKDGTLRYAFGTLKASLIPPADPKQQEDNAKKEKVPTLQTYFDVEAQAFRSFSIDRLVVLF